MIRVASVPADHPYVRAMTDADDVAVLPDPQPLGVTAPGQWWPPRWLEPDYLRSRVSEIDVLHVHFGFESTPTSLLSAVGATARANGVPLVLTVHDLHNPHFLDAGPHHRQLETLVSAATAVITLTSGAAEFIAAQWHREAVVLPHPHLLPLADVGAPRARHRDPVVAVHAKHLRANVDPWPLLDALTDGDIGAKIRLDLDDTVFSSPRCHDVPERIAHQSARGVDVRVHPPFSDAGLRDYLHEIDVLVLPYRFGTHSGWVELCHDAGVRAVVPDCGFFHEQHRSPAFGFDTHRLDRPTLLEAVRTAIGDVRADDGRENPVRRQERAAESRRVQRELVGIYRRAIDECFA